MTLHSVGHDAPSRWIQLRGPQNCRDLGGYLTSDGGIIPWRLALRSDSLAHATDADGADLVEHLRLRTVIDIRTDEERRAGSLRPEVVGDGVVLDMPLVRWWCDGDGDASFQRLLDTAGRPAAEIVEIIASCPKPFVIHGESGAWRVGFVVAVLLGILGVGDGDISRDHALSTAALPGRSCERVAMHWLIDEMRRRHGSVVGYALDHGLPAEVVHDLRAVLVA